MSVAVGHKRPFLVHGRAFLPAASHRSFQKQAVRSGGRQPGELKGLLKAEPWPRFPETRNWKTHKCAKYCFLRTLQV